MDVALYGRVVPAVAGPTRAAGDAMLGPQVNTRRGPVMPKPLKLCVPLDPVGRGVAKSASVSQMFHAQAGCAITVPW